jgi:hypothetical protein
MTGLQEPSSFARLGPRRSGESRRCLSAGGMSVCAAIQGLRVWKAWPDPPRAAKGLHPITGGKSAPTVYSLVMRYIIMITQSQPSRYRVPWCSGPTLTDVPPHHIGSGYSHTSHLGSRSCRSRPSLTDIHREGPIGHLLPAHRPPHPERPGHLQRVESSITISPRRSH